MKKGGRSRPCKLLKRLVAIASEGHDQIKQADKYVVQVKINR